MCSTGEGEAGMGRQYVCTITDDARHALIVSNYVILCGSVVQFKTNLSL